MAPTKCNACGYETAEQQEMDDHIVFHQTKHFDKLQDAMKTAMDEGGRHALRLNVAGGITEMSFKHDKTIDEVLDRYAEAVKGIMESGLV